MSQPELLEGPSEIAILLTFRKYVKDSLSKRLDTYLQRIRNGIVHQPEQWQTILGSHTPELFNLRMSAIAWLLRSEITSEQVKEATNDFLKILATHHNQRFIEVATYALRVLRLKIVKLSFPHLLSRETKMSLSSTLTWLLARPSSTNTSSPLTLAISKN